MSVESDRRTGDMGLLITHFLAVVLSILGGFELLLSALLAVGVDCQLIRQRTDSP